MNTAVQNAFNNYRTTYLRTGTGAQSNWSWIFAQGTGVASTNTITISEAHGYGMKIFALMGDRAVFDRLNAFRLAHPSPTDGRLMAWFIRTPGQVPNVQGGERANSATDGDLDIAYALLLAYTQWGDQTYLTQAQTVIQAIRESNMHAAPNIRTKLGDWHARNWSNNTPGSDPLLQSRTSDWRPSHFRAFARAMGTPGSEQHNYWNNAANMVHTMLASASNSTTGLMPDFVSRNPALPEPNPPVSGEHNMDRFAYNACRVPWFLALDYAHYGTAAARTRMNTISSWLRGNANNGAGGNVSNIGSMRHLDGRHVSGGNYNTLVFTAPFASGMIADPANQSFLNSTFDAISQGQHGLNPYNAYAAAIRVLNMLLITGNWWPPMAEGDHRPDPICEPEFYDLAMWAESGIGISAANPAGSSATATGEQINFSLTRDDAGWAQVWIAFDQGAMRGANAIRVSYTSNHPINVILGDTALSNHGRGFLWELPAHTGGQRTVTIYPHLFEQPSWVDDEDRVNIAVSFPRVQSIMIAAAGAGTTSGSIFEFQGLFCEGLSTSIIPQNRPVSSGAARVAGRGMTITRNAINFNIPSEQMVSLQITDVRGRMLFTQDINLNAAGVGTFNIPASIQRNQTLIVNVRGRNGFNTSRKMLLTR
jgi:endo-1,4-beta-D-glucanase Y